MLPFQYFVLPRIISVVYDDDTVIAKKKKLNINIYQNK